MLFIENSTTIGVEIAVNNYGFVGKEDERNNETRARRFVWHYQRAFEMMFMKFTGLNDDE